MSVGSSHIALHNVIGLSTHHIMNQNTIYWVKALFVEWAIESFDCINGENAYQTWVKFAAPQNMRGQK